MSKDNHSPYSEEFLNSFVDNQLSAEEKSQAYLDIGQDKSLNQQVCELRKMHDLVQLAYQNITPPPGSTRRQPARRHSVGVAAAILLALGVTLGITLGTQIRLEPSDLSPQAANPGVSTAKAPVHHTPAAQPVPATRVALAQKRSIQSPALDKPESMIDTVAAQTSVDLAIPPRTPVPAHGVNNRVLIHLTDDKSSQLATALDEIEGLMRYYRDSRQTAHVEVVMNGRGLDLVRVDTAPYAERVAQLQREYHNLTFAACQNTIDRLKREQNITVRLLPGVIIIDSGMAEIMRRQHQGWTYLQV